jgi:S-adenosylmethionine hydrolase
VKLDLKEPEVRGQKLFGEILSIDHFGNLITNIDEKKLSYFIKKRPFIIHVGKEAIRGMKKGYWEGKRGELIALLDSSGFMEISIREGNALKRMKVKRGDPVLISVIRDR